MRLHAGVFFLLLAFGIAAPAAKVKDDKPPKNEREYWKTQDKAYREYLKAQGKEEKAWAKATAQERKEYYRWLKKNQKRGYPLPY
jgi:hypothetical protein